MEGNYWTEKGSWQRLARARLDRRRFLAGAASLGAGALAYTLVGCREAQPTAPPAQEAPAGPTPGGVARYIAFGAMDFDNVDLHRVRANPTLWLSNWVLNKVVRYKNPDTGEVEGDLAESWEVIDPANYVFRVRRDVFWQNTPVTRGRQLTAEDIKWHFERQTAGRLLDGSTGDFARRSFYRRAVRVETPDQFTVRISLERPLGTFLTTLAGFAHSVPNREATERYGEGDPKTKTEEAMPATGPYILKQWRDGKEWVLQKNPNYFRKGVPYLDGLVVPLLFHDPAAARAAFEQKQLDAWAAPDDATTKAVLDAHRAEMWETLLAVANTVYFHLNMNQTFKDVRLVQAMNLAFDRRAAIQTFHQGLGQVSGPVTWLQQGFAIPLEQLVQMDGYRVNRDEDIRKARQLWQAAGGPALGEVRISVIQDWLALWPDAINWVPNMLNQALGVNQFVGVRGTYEDVTANLANGRFPNWFAWTSAVAGPDPREGIWGAYHSTSTTNYQKVNQGGVSVAGFDSLLDRMLSETNYEEAVRLAREAQRIILDHGQFGNVVLYNYMYRSAAWRYFNGAWKVRPTADKPGEGYAIPAPYLPAELTWLDQRHPTFRDRAPVTI
jgi:ABC-type transport system substrate-binding protein